MRIETGANRLVPAVSWCRSRNRFRQFPITLDRWRSRNKSPVVTTGLRLFVSSRFDADVVVDRYAQFLFAPEVLLGCLHADVSEKKLDLLVEFASRNVAQTRACAPQIVRSKVAELSFRVKLVDNAPDHPFRDAFAPHGARLAHTAKDMPRSD